MGNTYHPRRSDGVPDADLNDCFNVPPRNGSKNSPVFRWFGKPGEMCITEKVHLVQHSLLSSEEVMPIASTLNFGKTTAEGESKLNLFTKEKYRRIYGLTTWVCQRFFGKAAQMLKDQAWHGETLEIWLLGSHLPKISRLISLDGNRRPNAERVSNRPNSP